MNCFRCCRGGWLLWLSLGLSGCATTLATGSPTPSLMPEKKEIEMSRKAHPDIIEQYGRYKSDVLQGYVQRIGEQLAANSGRGHLIYRFTILDSGDVNTFSLPGGYVYITRGLLAYLNTEEQLAAILGHEIGHVAARHGSQKMVAEQAALTQYASGSILLSELRTEAAQAIFKKLGGVFIMGYGQNQELEANKLSAEYMAHIGYNPSAIVKAMDALKNHQLAESQWAAEENREPVVYHGVISQQGTASEPLQKVVTAASEIQVDAISLLKPHNFLSLLDDMIFGDSEINGVRRGRHFYHKELGYTIVLPQGWRIFNQPARLIAVATKGDAMLYTAVQERDESNSPRQFMETMLKLTDLWDGYKISPDKLKGFSAMTETESVFGMRPARINIIFFGHKVFIAIEVTKDDLTRERYKKTFRAITSSFRPLNKKQEKIAEAYRLGVIRADEKTQFATMAKKLTRLKHAEALLRLLNQFPPEGEPEPGKGIKILK